MKKKKIIILSVILVIIALLIIGTILKPKYELNKAISYINDGEYIKGYECVSNDDKNREIVQEVISDIYLGKLSNGAEQMTTIANQGTQIILECDRNNIDYSLDDNINILVKQLDDYINLENYIKPYMLVEQLKESYELYFSILKRFQNSFYDVLNHIDEFDNLEELNEDTIKLYALIQSFSHNYTYMEETKNILETME